VDEHPEFERLAPTPLSVICFRARPSHIQDDEEALNAFNEALLHRINAGGEAYLSHTRLHDRYALRLAIGNVRTTEAHVSRAWELIQQQSAAISRE
jgi:aromatic-L-amino-acid decarboxylase